MGGPPSGGDGSGIAAAMTYQDVLDALQRGELYLEYLRP